MARVCTACADIQYTDSTNTFAPEFVGDGLNASGFETASPHTGLASWKFTLTQSYVKAFGTEGVDSPGVQNYFRAFIKINALPTADSVIATGYDGTVIGSQIFITTTGGVRFQSAQNTAVNSVTLSTGTWYCLEYKYLSTTGTAQSAECRINGTTICTYAATTSCVIDHVRVGVVGTVDSTMNSVLVDDVFINDANGGSDNSWIGQTRVLTLLKPTADLAVGSSWARGAGGAISSLGYASVDNTPPTGKALASAADGDQLRNAATGITNPNADVDLTLQTPVAAGVPSDANLLACRAVACVADSSASLTHAGIIKALNPTGDSDASYTTRTGAGGTLPSNWQWVQGNRITSFGAFTPSSAPTMRIGKREAVSTSHLVCFMGMVMEWEPLVSTSDLDASPTTLNFTATEGGSNPATQDVSVVNSGGAGTTTFTLSDDAAWLSASGADLDAPDTVTVSVNISGLADGSYTGHVTINPTQAGDADITITVNLTVDPEPPVDLAGSPLALTFNAVVNESNPPSQDISVTIASGTAGPTTFTVFDNQAWISTSGGDLDAPATVTVSIDITGLAAGSHGGLVIINPDEPTDSNINVLITLNIATATAPGTVKRRLGTVGSGFIVRVDGVKVQHTGLEFSSVRRGGFEACSFTVAKGVIPRKGADVRVWDGMSTAWHGFVNSAGVRRTPGGARSASVSAVGYGSLFKTELTSGLFIDRDLSRWTGVPVSSRTDPAYTFPEEPYVAEDSVAPTLVVGFHRQDNTAGVTIAQARYDAGPVNRIGSFRGTGRCYESVGGVGGYDTLTAALWNHTVYLVNALFFDGVPAHGFETHKTISGSAATPFALPDSPTSFSGLGDSTDLRYGIVDLHYTDFTMAAVDGDWRLEVADIRVIGRHDLTIRNPGTSEGIYARDIIDYIVRTADHPFTVQCLGGAGGDYILQQSAYHDPVPPEQIIEEMVRYLGWGYGTWEPDAFSNVPVFMYGAPPTDVTATVSYDDCSNDSIDDVLMEQYTDAIVLSTNASGSSERDDITHALNGVPEKWTNTMLLDLGLQGNNVAAAHGAFLLALSQDNSRAAGSIQLPATVKVSGGVKPSYLLRPGRERIAIHGIPIDTQKIGENVRGDTFSIARISVTEDANGVPSVTAEVDSGADLVETLSARMELATQVSGVG